MNTEALGTAILGKYVGGISTSTLFPLLIEALKNRDDGVICLHVGIYR